VKNATILLHSKKAKSIEQIAHSKKPITQLTSNQYKVLADLREVLAVFLYAKTNNQTPKSTKWKNKTLGTTKSPKPSPPIYQFMTIFIFQ
jgi:hypothetical protein